MPTVKMSASWENVRRAENLSQMMQKDRNGELGKNATALGAGWQGVCVPRWNSHHYRLLGKPHREALEQLAGSAGRERMPATGSRCETGILGEGVCERNRFYEVLEILEIKGTMEEA